jgi:hypothetical protein
MAKRKKPSDESSPENPDASNDADNFGLPEIDYKPLDQKSESESSATDVTPVASSEPATTPTGYSEPIQESKSPTYSYMDEEPKSKAPVFIGIAVAVVVLIAAFLIYQYVYVPQQEKEARQLAEQQRKDREAAEKGAPGTTST